jgi:hypothetical protein
MREIFETFCTSVSPLVASGKNYIFLLQHNECKHQLNGLPIADLLESWLKSFSITFIGR